MDIVFFGGGSIVIPIVDVLFRNFGLKEIFTTEKGDGKLTSFAKENGIEITSIDKFDDQTINRIQALNPSVGIVANFGLIIPLEILDLFPSGILNIHPSLLPKYRGSTPVPSALLSGDRETGVSLIRIDDQVDHGPILAQEEYEIRPEDNAETLLEILFKTGALLLDQNLEDYLSGYLVPEEQNDDLATHSELIKKSDGFVDIKKPLSRQKLQNMIRAYHPWPGVFTKTEINGKEVIIKLLPDQMVQVEGKNPQTFKDFSNGYKEGKDILKKLGLT